MPFYHDLKSYRDMPVDATNPAHEPYPNKADWVSRRILALRHDLNTTISGQRRPNSLIIGSWNIRAFDGGIPRLDESFHYIAEVISAFDICALQEIKSDLGPLKRLMKLLGPNWDYFVSDVSDHEQANYERMAFVYNTNKVFFRNQIGEIVLRSDALSTGTQIARSPFFASFQAGWFRFTLVSAHIIFGETNTAGLARRAEEVEAITKALVKRAKKEDQVYVFLGDMNVDSKDGVVMQALKDSKMEVPDFPTTNLGGTKFYDQLAFTVKGKAERKTRLIDHGVFDWRNAVFGPIADGADFSGDPARVTRVDDAANRAHYEPICGWNREHNPLNPTRKPPYANFDHEYKEWTTFEMSDHLPIWVEIETDYSDDYLGRYVTS